jgi:hypothetical protein
MNQNRLILLFLIIFVILAVSVWWLFFGNRSYVTVETEAPYKVTVEKYRWFDCQENICEFSAPFGEKKLCVSKTGFDTICEIKSLPRKQEVFWKVNLKKTPIIRSAVDEKPPPITEENDIVQITDGTKYRLGDAGDFMRINDDGSQELLFTFSGFDSVEILAIHDLVLINNGAEIFEIDPIRSHRKRLISGADLSFAALDEDEVIIHTLGKTLIYNAMSRSVEELEIYAEQNHAVACSSKYLFIIEMQPDRIGRLHRLNRNTKKMTVISDIALQQYDDFRLYCTESSRSVGIYTNNKANLIVEF